MGSELYDGANLMHLTRCSNNEAGTGTGSATAGRAQSRVWEQWTMEGMNRLCRVSIGIGNEDEVCEAGVGM